MTATRASAAGITAAAAGFLLPVVYSPSVYSPYWSPKAAVLLIAGLAGLPFLMRLRRTRLRRTAGAALLYLGAVVLSTLLSPDPAGAAVGLYHWGTGALFLCSVVGLWALGANVPEDDRPLVRKAIVAALTLTAAVAVLQGAGAVRLPTLDAGGRAWGLAGNAVHLGALAAGGAALAAWEIRRASIWGAVGLLMAAAVQLSGTRFALLVLAAVAVAAVWRAGPRRGGGFAALLLTGVLLGSFVGGFGDIQSATGRSTADGSTTAVATGGARVRLEVWSYARHAVVQRPLVGHGPGRFRAATSQDRTLTVAQIEGGDSVYSDGHNIVVEHLVTTGVLGAASLLVWLVLAFRHAGGGFLLMAAALAAMSLVQPLSVASTPLLALALGLAARREEPPRQTMPWPSAAGALAGAALAAWLLVGDFHLEQTRLDLRPEPARTADSLLGTWPEPASLRARVHAFQTLSGESTRQAAVRWRRIAVDRDPTDPVLWIMLADEQAAADDWEAARQSLHRALELNPYSTAALSRLARTAAAEGAAERAEQYLDRALAVRPDRRLEREVERLLRDATS